MPRYAHSGPAWVEITFDPATQVLPGKGLTKVGVENLDGSFTYTDAPDDLTISPQTAGHLSDEERENLGVRPIIEAPAGALIVDGLTDVAGEPHQATRAPTLDEQKAAKRAELNVALMAVVAEGFPCTLGPDSVPERLQVRDSDLPRWLAVRAVCKEQDAGGHGADSYPIPLRSTSNVNYPFTYAEGLALMDGMLAWWAAVLATSWTHADAISSAANEAALDAIDPAAGWPQT